LHILVNPYINSPLEYKILLRIIIIQYGEEKISNLCYNL
jgi:hypothetical protein